MPALTQTHKWIIGSVLMLVMFATRAHVFDHGLDASWAVFLLAGFYLQNCSVFAVFMAAAVAIDCAAVGLAGVSAYCFTPAYAALVPAHAILFAAGRWFAGRYSEDFSAFAALVPAFFVGVIGCEVVSSGAFYAFSGRFEELSLGTFLAREMTFTPHVLAVAGLYVAIAALLHVALVHTFAARKASA